MKRATGIQHEFVELIPGQLAEATLYVSIEYATVVHLCLCGCGKKVVTPLGPTEWRLIFDGETVSLMPSVGNWSFDCQSHYWIERNQVFWAKRWSPEKIEVGRARDRRAKQLQYGEMSAGADGDRASGEGYGDAADTTPAKAPAVGRVRDWIRRLRGSR